MIDRRAAIAATHTPTAIPAHSVVLSARRVASPPPAAAGATASISSPPPAPAVRRIPVRALSTARALRVLVAEMKTPGFTPLLDALAMSGFDVHPAEGADDLLYQCECAPPDVLVLDAELPGCDGYEICDQLRHDIRLADMTVVMLCDASDEMKRTYLGQMVDFVGGDYFLAKPCDSRLVARLVEDIAGSEEPPQMIDRFPTRSVLPSGGQCSSDSR